MAGNINGNDELSEKIQFFESSFFSMPARGTTYSFVPLRTPNSEAKILIGSLEKVYCLESSGAPSLVEMFLPSTPQRVEIVSMDAFQTSDEDSDYVIGITYVKGEDATQTDENSFKVFNGWDFASEQKFQNISQNSFSSKLNFMPYKLYHAKVGCAANDETVWLLSGSDLKIHMFHFDEKSLWEETDLNKSFPELSGKYGIILNMQVQYSKTTKKRTTVVAEESGMVHIYEVNIEDSMNPDIKQSRSILWDWPVMGLTFFETYTSYETPPLLGNVSEKKSCEQNKESELIIGTSLEGCFHLKDFFDGEFKMLPESSAHDVITCCISRDIDFDGKNEILVGTSGQVILIYKEQNDNSWKLVGNITLPSPVISMAYENVAGDGVCSLVVMTFGGIHIYEHENFQAMEVLMKRLKKIVALKE